MTSNPMSGQLAEDFQPRITWIWAMSLVCSSRHSLYVWYSKRPRFTRRFFLQSSQNYIAMDQEDVVAELVKGDFDANELIDALNSFG